MKQWIVTIMLCTFLISPSSVDDDEIKVIVKSSPDAELQTTLSVQSPKMINAFLKSHLLKTSISTDPTDAYVDVRHDGKKTRFVITQDGQFYDPKNKQKLVLQPELQRQLIGYIQTLRRKHYGTLTPWHEVRSLLLGNNRFQITDLETGLRFNVQKRAGNKHADVQPLTKADTKIMKHMYNGKWSWDRRAILVRTDNRTLAASMNGMPHGKGSIPNGFPGHFCVHFFGSTTHRTNNTDPGHHLMIYKAAGKLDDYLEQVSPEQLVDIYLTALNQHDGHLLFKTVSLAYAERLKNIDREAGLNIDVIKRISGYSKDRAPGSLFVKIPVQVYTYRGHTGAEKEWLDFVIVRNLLKNRWEITSVQKPQQVEQEQH